MYNDGFSEFEIKESSIKVGDDEAFEKIGCVGTAEETLNIRFVNFCILSVPPMILNIFDAVPLHVIYRGEGIPFLFSNCAI